MGPRSPELIWNKGIAARCDRRIPDEFPNGHEYVHVPTLAGRDIDSGPPDLIDDPERFDDIGRGELVWVRGSWLPSFVEQVLPRITDDFVLVTGDTDSSLPSEAPKIAAALLNSPHMLRWYTQNYDGSGPEPRISRIPIGLDLHTASERPAWGEAVATPAEQEAELEAIARTLPPLAERIPAIYVDFGWSTDARTPRTGARLFEPRNWIAAVLRPHPHVVHQDARLPRSKVWRRRGRYAFSLSPHGNGLDCHRTWEGLILGQVVLVPSSSLDPLFEDVMAFPFDHWGDLTSDNLARWMDRAGQLADPARALTSEHWITRMRRGTDAPR